MNATIEVICYKSKVLNNGNHPLMLRVTKDRKTKYISLGISIPSKEWDFTKNQPKPNCSNKEHIEKIILTKKTQYNSKIIEFTANKKEYTPQILVDAVENTLAPKTIEELYCSHIKTLIKTQKIGNSQVYSYSLRSLRKFTAGKLNIPCSAISLDWLKSYEKWLKEKSCQGNTISQLFRTLRRIYNLAIEQGYASKEAYPFDKFEVSKFNTPTAKRAIEKEEILKIMAADLSDRDFYTRFSRDIFVFSYLGAGINFTDIALLKIDANGLQPIEYGNSDDVVLGEWVLAVGNPYNLTSTVTAGIISAKARQLGGKMNLESFLQTDAAVNPGNSGGALVNAKGELIGINTAIQSPTGSYSGYSFAVPVNVARKVVSDLKEYGKVQRAMIGIKMQELTPALAKEYKLKEQSGIYVAEVIPGGAAESPQGGRCRS